MKRTRLPEHPWQRDTLVLALETVELAGERVPLSCSLITVEDRRITTTLYHPVAWANQRRGSAGGLSGEEVRLAVATARTNRKLVPEDLREGDAPWAVFSLLEKVFRCVAKHDSLVVMHDPERDLPVLMNAVEAWMDIDLAPVSAVSTAVLERARRLGLRQALGEKPAAFYRRIAGVGGELPDLLSCYREQEWADGTLGPTDRLFPAFATCLIYQHHFGGRLLGASTGKPSTSVTKGARHE